MGHKNKSPILVDTTFMLMLYTIRMAKSNRKRVNFLMGPIDLKRVRALQKKLEVNRQYVMRRALYELAVKEKVEP
ncbi:MAG: hypothetical protein WB870_02385 [Gallionellaceae bacterium]